MLKNKNGITILTLVITVLILAILTGVSVNTGFSTMREIRAGRVISNMTMVKAKVEMIQEENQFNEMELVGNKVSPENLSAEEKKLFEDFDSWEWHKWDSDILKGQGLDTKMLGENEYFLVNYPHAEVIYSKGSSLDGTTTYHSLTGLKQALED